MTDEILQKFKITPLAWMAATMIAALTMVASASQFFNTRKEAEMLERKVEKVDNDSIRRNEETNRRLERIEDKIDQLISRGSR